MSADNYLYVRKRKDGKFGVSMRFASVYYSDEGHTVESLQAAQQQMRELGQSWYPVDESWISEPPEDHYGVFDDATEALWAAHKAEQEEGVVEYGVALGPGVQP